MNGTYQAEIFLHIVISQELSDAVNLIFHESSIHHGQEGKMFHFQVLHECRDEEVIASLVLFSTFLPSCDYFVEVCVIGALLIQ